MVQTSNDFSPLLTMTTMGIAGWGWDDLPVAYPSTMNNPQETIAEILEEHGAVRGYRGVYTLEHERGLIVNKEGSTAWRVGPKTYEGDILKFMRGDADGYTCIKDDEAVPEWMQGWKWPWQ